MKAVFIRRYGGNEVVEVGELPKPAPKAGQALVQVYAASVNPRDWLLRDGRYQLARFTGGFPKVLGSDLSGIVAEAGGGARRFPAGTPVFGMQTAFGRFGAFAEYVAIAETALAEKPAAISHEQAAAVPCAGLTAYQALAGIGRVGPGSRVAVVGASGGVGSYAVQIARVLGAEVTGVASGANAELVRSLGAGRTIDYRKERFNDVLIGQDVVFDTLGRESLASCARVLSPGGRYITTVPNLRSFTEAFTSRFAHALTFGRASSCHVVTVRAEGAHLAILAGWIAEGRMRSVIDSVYPLSEARAALEKSRTFRSRGKLVMRVRD